MSFKEEEQNSILQNVQFDYSNSAIIKPNQQGFDKGREVIKKFHPIVVDSRDRDMNRFPDPSRYVVDLDDQIEDVIAAELVAANIPMKHYIVNNTNNSFQCTLENQTSFLVEVNHGDYSPTELSLQINDEIVNQTTGQSIDVVYDSIQDKFIFNSSLPFSLDFDKRTNRAFPFNMSKLLGYKSVKVEPIFQTSDDRYVAVPPFRKNFEESNYALLKITGFYAHKSLNQIIDKTFAVVPSKRMDQNIVSEMQPIRKDFNPPIPRLTKLQISFVDRNGDYIDFQNHDHYFIIRLESFRHTRKYASFVDM